MYRPCTLEAATIRRTPALDQGGYPEQDHGIERAHCRDRHDGMGRGKALRVHTGDIPTNNLWIPGCYGQTGRFYALARTQSGRWSQLWCANTSDHLKHMCRNLQGSANMHHRHYRDNGDTRKIPAQELETSRVRRIRPCTSTQ